MFEVNVYLETSMKGPGTREGWHVAVLEFVDKKGESITREDFGFEKETTYHKSIILALTKSLKRLNTSCHVNVYTDSVFVMNSIENNLARWKENGFLNVKGEPIKNQEEWKALSKAMAGHKIEFCISKRHFYSSWITSEINNRFGGENVENTECESK